jgi:hypothetical protein
MCLNNKENEIFLVYWSRIEFDEGCILNVKRTAITKNMVVMAKKYDSYAQIVNDENEGEQKKIVVWWEWNLLIRDRKGIHTKKKYTAE